MSGASLAGVRFKVAGLRGAQTARRREVRVMKREEGYDVVKMGSKMAAR